MSSEKDMRKRVVKILKPLHAVSVENGVGAGTPDVNYTGGWIELKSMAAWPVDPDLPLRVDHFTTQQRLWLRKRWLAGGNVWLLIKVADDWLLLTGWDAAVYLGRMCRADLVKQACASWEGGLSAKGLLEFLRESSPQRRLFTIA